MVTPIPPTPSAPGRANGLPAWLRAFWPAPVAADWRERLRVLVGAALGILITGWLCGLGSGTAAWPWLIAPMGASAVLIFGAPASPLAQPWPVIGGNTLSALVGVACVHWGGPPALMAALAVGAAIGVMFALRCLHPPGGASALLVVLNGVADPAFVLYPVLANAMLLVAAGVAYNHATRRDYPHRPRLRRRTHATPRPRRSTPNSTPCWRATATRWTSAATSSRRCSKTRSCSPTSASWPTSAAATSCRDASSR